MTAKEPTSMLSEWTDAQLVESASSQASVEITRRLKDSVTRSNRAMTVLIVVICVCTVLLLIAAGIQIEFQVMGCQ